MKNNIRTFVIKFIIFSLLFSLSCTKSDCTGSSGKNTTFTSAGEPVSNSVYLENVSANDDTITLAVKIKEGTDVYGTSLEIIYDGSKIMYLSSSKGDFLSQDGKEIDFIPQLENNTQGKLLIGTNRRGNVSGVNGSGVIATIVFKVVTEQENTSIEFKNTSSLLNSNSGSISGTAWFGGTLSYK